MGKRRFMILIGAMAVGMVLCIPGCGENAKGNSAKAVEAEVRAAASAKPEREKADEETAERKQAGRKETVELVGIKAHVKEIRDDMLLISSDTDDFPGAFAVIGAQKMPQFPELEGGTSILISMRVLGEKDEQGHEKYAAEQILVLQGDEEDVQEDILLTGAPDFTLCDVLSSRMEPVSLRSGNYTWNVEENGEGTGVVACGAAPLEEASMDFTVKLKIPEYNGMDSVPYSFSTKIAPDLLVVRCWNAEDIGNSKAKEESVVRYYYRQPLLQLEAGKVYEFAAEWKDENKDKNGFYGSASYVLVTQ